MFKLPRVYSWWKLILGSTLFFEFALWFGWALFANELILFGGVFEDIFATSELLAIVSAFVGAFLLLRNDQAKVPFWVATSIFVMLLGTWIAVGVLAGNLAPVIVGLPIIALYAFLFAGNAALALLGFEPPRVSKPQVATSKQQ